MTRALLLLTLFALTAADLSAGPILDRLRARRDARRGCQPAFRPAACAPCAPATGGYCPAGVCPSCPGGACAPAGYVVPNPPVLPAGGYYLTAPGNCPNGRCPVR